MLHAVKNSLHHCSWITIIAFKPTRCYPEKPDGFLNSHSLEI
jgi:hypothetical protein